MTYQQLSAERRWYRAECRFLAQQAQADGFPVTARQVAYAIATWRDWFYGLITADQVTWLTGIRQTASAAV